jgi:hypothetical protein
MVLGLTSLSRAGNSVNAQNLVESILLFGPVIYLLLKYSSSEIIFKYQNPDYHPRRIVKICDDAMVQVINYVILPLCFDFIVASFFLLLLKWVAPDKLGTAANWVYAIYLFNKKYFASPIYLILLVLSILILLNVLSKTALKKAKSIKKTVTIPFKLAATLLFFVNTDTGISGKYISWKINQTHPEKSSENVTFNATTAQEEEAQKAVQLYVKLMMEQLQQNADNGDSSSSHAIEDVKRAIDEIKSDYNKDPTILADIADGKAGASSALNENQIDNFNNVIEADKTKQNDRPKRMDLHNSMFGSTTVVSELFQSLTDERKDIKESKVSQNQAILEDLLGDFIGRTALFNALPDKIPFYDFAKDKAFDLLKDNFTKGFSYLVKKVAGRTFTKLDIPVTVDYIKTQCQESYNHAVSYIRQTNQLVVDMRDEYEGALKLKEKMKPGEKNITELAAFVETFPHDQSATAYKEEIGILESKMSPEERSLRRISRKVSKADNPVEHKINERVQERVHETRVVHAR